MIIPFPPNRRPQIALVLIFITAGILFSLVKLHPVPYRTTNVEPQIARYAFPIYFSVHIAIASLSLFVAALFFATTPGVLFRVFSLLPFASGLVLAGAALDTATSHVSLTPTTARLPAAGFPFRHHHTLEFATLAAVTLDPRSDEICLYKTDRTSVTLPIGDLITAALPELSRALELHHVPVTEFD
jgi:hypothetical protein